MQKVFQLPDYKVKVSDSLLHYLVTYKWWLDYGAPNEAPFCRWDGLCVNTNRAFMDNPEKRRKVYLELTKLFNTCWPFGRWNYNEHWKNSTQHLDQNRNTWVNKVIDYNLMLVEENAS